MDALRTFLDMGSYGNYVWPSYGLTVAIMGWLVLATLRRLRAREQELARRQGEFPARRNRSGTARTSGDAASS